MKKVAVILFVLFNLAATFSQNSLILNSNFENTTWPEMAWMSQTNTGSSIIINENDPTFTAINVTARSGSHFAYIGGVQNPKGRYEGSLAQEFEIIHSGNGYLTFFYRYIRESADPGSYIKLLIDGNEVWSIAPHFIVDAEESYIQVQIHLGHLEAGHHTIELKGYEFPAGGDLPMQFAFDDMGLMVTPTASIEENNQSINISLNNGMIQLISNQSMDQDAVIEIADLSGKIVFTHSIRFTNQINIVKPMVNPGIYLISLKTTDKTFTKKFYLN